jgi:hypothetical protein
MGDYIGAHDMYFNGDTLRALLLGNHFINGAFYEHRDIDRLNQVLKGIAEGQIKRDTGEQTLSSVFVSSPQLAQATLGLPVS